MKHAIIPGVMERSDDPRKLVDPFAPGGDAHKNVGPTHEDMAGGPFVLLENVEVRVKGWDVPWVVFRPLSYRREAAAARHGGPVRGMRPLVCFMMEGRYGVTRAGSQQELELRYAWFSDGDDYLEASARAKRLLLEHLNPLQRLWWKWGGFFYVLGEVNELYRVEEGNGVAVVDPYTHRPRLHLCYHPETFMPHEDVALATKLLIESGPEGEELLLETARTRLVKHPPFTPNALTRNLRAMERELLAA